MSDYKLLVFKEEARQKLAAGAQKLADAVVSTLGPRSRNVALNRQYPGPLVLHDGVSVANEIRLKDPFEDMGAVLIREAASKTNDLAGDGTTTATLLANTMLQEGLKEIGGGIVDGIIKGNVNPMKLRDDILAYSQEIVAMLDNMTKKLTTREEYEQVATISSGYPEIGKLVADAIEKVSKDGVIMVEEASGFDSTLEIQEGMEIENGYLSQYFVTDPDRNVVEYTCSGDDYGYVLMTDQRIADGMKLVPIVEKVIRDNNRPLLIIADDVVGPALQALALTKLRTGAKLVAIVAPEFADRRKEMLQDIAVLTGGNVIAADLNKKLEDVELKDLGRFRSIRISQTHTSITPKYPDAAEILERANALKEQIKIEENPYRKSRLEYRLGKLSNGVAIISVGGSSDTEIKEKRERVIDAVHAAKAALAEGIIPGGGVALKDIANELSKRPAKASETTMDTALPLILKTLQSPILTILSNAGHKSEGVLELPKGQGINVITGKTIDMLEAGIIDPVKVTKLAVLHAFSVAAMILTTETLISDDIEVDRGIQKVKAV